MRINRTNNLPATENALLHRPTRRVSSLPSGLLRRCRGVRLAAASLLLIAGALTAAPVFSDAIVVPIDVDFVGTAHDERAFLPGEQVALGITFSGTGTTNVQVLSQPAGAVTYSGSASGPSSTIVAETSPDAPPGPVTVTVIGSGGGSVTATLTALDTAETIDEPAEDSPAPSPEASR